MSTEELVDDALCEVAESFAIEAIAHRRLQRILVQFPNTTPKETWDALPILFWRRILISEILRSLPYDEFLQTPYWIAVSEHAKAEQPWCVLCTEPMDGPLEVHHRTYQHRGSEWLHLGDLTVLCGDCHQTFHKKGIK